MLENGFVHELREESGHVLRSDVEEVGHLELHVGFVGLINEVRPVPVGLVRLDQSCIEGVVVESLEDHLLSRSCVDV